MTIVAVVLSTLFVIILILILLRPRRVSCRDCLHFSEHYITSIHGEGIFKFGYCQRLIHDCRMVEPDIERKCQGFEKKGRVEMRPCPSPDID